MVPLAFWQSENVQRFIPPRVQSFVSWPRPETPSGDTVQTAEEKCHLHTYTTEIISTDPLIIYIHNFTSADEAEQLIAAGYTPPDRKSVV